MNENEKKLLRDEELEKVTGGETQLSNVTSDNPAVPNLDKLPPKEEHEKYIM